MNPKNLSANYIHFQDLKGFSVKSTASRDTRGLSARKKLFAISLIAVTGIFSAAYVFIQQDTTLQYTGSQPTNEQISIETKVFSDSLAMDSGRPTKSGMVLEQPLKPSTEITVSGEPSGSDYTAETAIDRNSPVQHVANSVSEPALQLEQRPKPKWLSVKVNKGDSLSAIFSKYELTGNRAVEVANASVDNLLNSLEVGRTIDIKLNSAGQFIGLKYELNKFDFVHVEKTANSEYTSRIEQIEPKVRIRDVSTPIYGNLYQTAEDLGIENSIVDSMSDIFRWDIDFSRDIQGGDRFSVIYEQKFLEDDLIASGDILAAEFIINGQVTRAIRHLDKDGHVEYYTPEGDSLRKAFIRNPVRSARISSKFSKGRYHPILNKWRAHKGVDYAAPRGTPVMATADGVIQHIGRKGAYGNAIIIDHGHGYTTLYGHMKDYRKGLKNGARVQQGQTIGYVGSTGMSTGPHLHYEFQINGNQVDPLAVKLPNSLPIDSDEYGDFVANAEVLVRRLDALQGQSVAADAIAQTQPSG